MSNAAAHTKHYSFPWYIFSVCPQTNERALAGWLLLDRSHVTPSSHVSTSSVLRLFIFFSPPLTSPSSRARRRPPHFPPHQSPPTRQAPRISSFSPHPRRHRIHIHGAHAADQHVASPPPHIPPAAGTRAARHRQPRLVAAPPAAAGRHRLKCILTTVTPRGRRRRRRG